MGARERRRATLEGEVAECAALVQTAAVVDDVAVTAELRARCAEWRALLTENPAQAQSILRRLVPERLTLQRKPSGIWLTGMATFGPLTARIALCQGMVPRHGTYSIGVSSRPCQSRSSVGWVAGATAV
jgi:hypothetical protein